MEWIDQIDHELVALREREARLYYNAELSQDIDGDALERVAQTRRRLLLRPGVASEAAHLVECGDSLLIRRKARLLQLAILRTRVDDDPDLLACQNALEHAQRHFQDDRKTPTGTQRYLETTMPAFRKRLAVANHVARREGFASYPEAKLTWQEFSLVGLSALLDRVQETCADECREVLTQCDAQRLSPDELDRAVDGLCSTGDDRLAGMDLGVVAARTLADLGHKPEHARIRIEFLNLPYPGAVHTLRVGADVRVVLADRGVRSFRHLPLLMHELGHALYSAYVPDSVLLLDSRIGREAFAECFAGLVETPGWLERHTDLQPPEIDVLLERRRSWHAYNQMVLVQWSRFELALHDDPEADFLKTWKSVTRDVLGMYTSNPVYADFVFLYPLDAKDYILAHRIRQGVLHELRQHFGDDLIRPQVLGFLVNNYCVRGNRTLWTERFPGAS